MPYLRKGEVMNRMRWLLVAAMFVGVSSVASAADTGAGAIGGVSEERANESSYQKGVAGDIVEKSGANASQVNTALIKGSKGTFVPALQQVLSGGAPAAFNESAGNIATVMTASGNGTASGDAVVGALNILNGQSAAAGVDAANITVGEVGNVIAGRQDVLTAQRREASSQFGSDSAMASAYMNRDFAKRIWAAPFYAKQEQKSKDGYQGYDYDAWGVSLGYDQAFGAFTVGGAFTYSQGDYDAKKVHDDNTIKNYGFSLYGQYYSACTGWFANIAGGYNYADNEWKRYESITANWQKGDNHTNSYWFGGSIGKDFAFGENSNILVTPTVGLYYSHSTASAYNSRGLADLAIGKLKGKSLTLPVNVAVSYRLDLDECSSLTFKLNGGYSYNFKKDGAKGNMRYDYAGADTIIVNGMENARHGWNAGAGVKYSYNQFDFGVDYRYDGKKKFSAHRVAATVGINF